MMADSGNHWHAALTQRINASILPGEATLSGLALEEAALFLLEAAQHRDHGQPAILVRSATGKRRVTRIAVVNRDVPFLVASISHALAAHGLSVDLLVHPVLPVVRDKGRQLADLPVIGGEASVRESFIYIETDRIDARQRRALETDLAETIADVRAAVTDWPLLCAAIKSDAATLSDPEGTALLTWLGDGMMTQLGHVTRHRDGSQSDELGICRQSPTGLLAEASWKRAFAWFDDDERRNVLLIVKANRLSLVHRRVPLDLFIVPVLAGDEVIALSVHAGIWTSAALSAAPTSVPLLRRQLQAITDKLGIASDGHDHHSLIHAFSVLPHDLVISFSATDTMRVVTAMMALIDRPRPRAALVAAPLERHVFAFVWLPRDMLSTTVREAIEALLESVTGTTTLDWSLSVEGGNLALLRYVLDARHGKPRLDAAVIDARLQDMLRGWTDAVEAALVTSEEPGRAAALALRHAPAFPAAYRATYGAGEAARDIARLRHLDGAPGRAMGRDARLYRLDSDAPDLLRLKVYQAGGVLPLSDAVPALENFGFRVLSELPTWLVGEQLTTIHDFLLGLPVGSDTDTALQRAPVIEQAITTVLNQQADDDVFNKLVIHCGLAAQEAEWLRAFYRYLRQANVTFTIHSVVDALANTAPVTAALIDLFRVRHDPAFAGDRVAASAAAEDAIRAGLGNVSAINDDRILRLYWQVILAVLRTNVFAPAGSAALAFKFDSALVPGLPKPVPWREIFVYSRRVEGIHLRAGPVARGGLRWSDRRDDFRTEVLGLMKAQRVKNAVIVPTGAKGGFYPKCLPNPALAETGGRDAWATEGRESYKVFITALLSVTDNIVAGAVVHPAGVVVHDGEDPYFVVAADKGTATFSDTANTIALKHGFWLGDAFASGGSNGYDHKAMGITARGAWLSVQRHFVEMGVDVQSDLVRVVGCGDMSGDVFGNGLLLSKSVKLIAAFDHRHIFIDPEPDPGASWEERQRLFNLPRSSWADYSAHLLSKGGGIFPRSLKTIPLSEAARAGLGIAESALDPESLIAAIVKSPVDLIWFGGIGTYVKAASESNAVVGDPANDSLRVNAADVRARVIGEGANLGVTQAGRIEFGLGGGRINTDFIDNSAGVDCSDNEVNIKIALDSVSGLDPMRRNALLAEMTEDVAALVLEDNRLQALALSIAQGHGAQAMGAYVRLIETLEESGALDRLVEGLAGSDVLARRAAEGPHERGGLTRPELAVLLSNAKLALQEALEHCDLAQTPAAEPLLLGDFPPQLQRDYRPALLAHRLRRQIVATVVANQVINRMGMVHPFELAEEEGASLAEIGSAFVAACGLLDMHSLWQAIDNATMPEAARLMLFDAAALALRGHMADLLRSGSTLTGAIGAAMADLDRHADTLLGREARGQIAGIVTGLEQAGAPPHLAALVGNLYAQDGAIGLATLAQATQLPPVELAETFVSLGALLGIDWAQARAALMSPADPWDRLLVAGLARDFQAMRFDFLRTAATGSTPASGLQQRVAAWSATHAPALARMQQVIARAQSAPVLTPAMLAQIASQARNLLQH